MREKGAEMKDGLGFTEQEWEKMWESETATSTVHKSSMDDESYCEGCDSPVTYSGPDDKYGTCGCES
jgi:hypothetical protein